jgi:HAD superfamily hydrolase (TIGR01509 family)
MLPWDAIDTALLDMDGVLLDRHFDDDFWHHRVPAHYAARHGVSPHAARARLIERYRAHEGTLAWTDLDFWSRELDLDIPALKSAHAHGVAFLPRAPCFLTALAERGVARVLVTNAHPETVRIKMGATVLGDYLDAVVSAFDLGVGKEDAAFWERLRGGVAYRPERSVLVEDSAANLASARAAGVAHLVHVSHPNSRAEPLPDPGFPSVAGVRDLLAGILAPRSRCSGTGCGCSAPAPSAPPG